jgi:hypothetical protein
MWKFVEKYTPDMAIHKLGILTYKSVCIPKACDAVP